MSIQKDWDVRVQVDNGGPIKILKKLTFDNYKQHEKENEKSSSDDSSSESESSNTENKTETQD